MAAALIPGWRLANPAAIGVRIPGAVRDPRPENAGADASSASHGVLTTRRFNLAPQAGAARLPA